MQEAPSTAFGEEVKAAIDFREEYMRGGRRRGVLCSNPDCRWNKEVKGGSFPYSHRFGGFVCQDCLHMRPVFNPGKNLWSFTTTHLNGERIEVKGLSHLRQLEKQFGVSNQALNNDQSHWDIPPSVRPEPMNPELARFLGKASEMGRMDKGSRVSGDWQR
jgi:hypothetical protein